MHWPRVSRGGRLVTEVRRQRQSSSPTRPFQRPGRSLKADWLDERSTSNGAVCSRVDPARPGGLRFSADRQWRSKPNPPGRWRGDGRPPLQTALPDGDAITLAQGSTTLSQGPTGSAPGTASVYKMRLRADPHRSQITLPIRNLPSISCPSPLVLPVCND